MSQEKQPMRVRFSYREGLDYRTVHVTGARGAVTPQAAIRFDLYTEFLRAPDEEFKDLKQDGTIVDVEDSNGGPSAVIEIVRQLQVGVVMSAADADSLATWLKQKVEEAKSAMKIMQSVQKGNL